MTAARNDPDGLQVANLDSFRQAVEGETETCAYDGPKHGKDHIAVRSARQLRTEGLNRDA